MSTQAAAGDILTVKQAAAYLGLPASTIYTLVAGRKIAHHRHGVGRGTIRFKRSDLKRYQLSCEVPVAEPVEPSPSVPPRKAATLSGPRMLPGPESWGRRT